MLGGNPVMVWNSADGPLVIVIKINKGICNYSFIALIFTFRAIWAKKDGCNVELCHY